MPLVRISLRRELPDESKECISQTIHAALMDAFNIPANDYFHVIEELDAEQIRYPQRYLGVSHSNNMIYVQIIAGTGRTAEQKKQLYGLIASGIAAKTNVSANDVIIVLVENGGKENWSFGKGEIQELAHINPAST